MTPMIRFRTLFPVMVIITVLILLAPIALAAIFAVFTYHGECYGFTDGSWPCTRQEYLSDQIFWSVWLDLPIGLFLIVCWLVAVGLWFHKRRTTGPDGLPFSTVMLIPLGGAVGSGFLLSTIPIFLRLYFWLSQ